MLNKSNVQIVRVEVPNLSAFVRRNGQYVDMIGDILHVSAVADQSTISITGQEEQIKKAVSMLEKVDSILGENTDADEQAIRYLFELSDKNQLDSFPKYISEPIIITPKGKTIRCKTIGQQIYIDSIIHNEMTVCIGPAGSGKTFLGVAMAVSAFRNKEVSKIILTRPAVEAGERLGFLPGDLQEKVDPYMQPIYDSLRELLGIESFQRYYDKGLIEVSPLAFMRGRTLDDSFIILDEAQNTTVEQMMMFLTRIGMNSKACICGDITQTDLPKGMQSGLVDAVDLLRDVKGIQSVFLTDSDIVRNPLVQRIIRAYQLRKESRS
jgi:phosphate starvation-inducible PhoH-like protein